MKEIFSDVLFCIFYAVTFVCWAAIFIYGIIKLSKRK